MPNKLKTTCKNGQTKINSRQKWVPFIAQYTYEPTVDSETKLVQTCAEPSVQPSTPSSRHNYCHAWAEHLPGWFV